MPMSATGQTLQGFCIKDFRRAGVIPGKLNESVPMQRDLRPDEYHV